MVIKPSVYANLADRSLRAGKRLCRTRQPQPPSELSDADTKESTELSSQVKRMSSGYGSNSRETYWPSVEVTQVVTDLTQPRRRDPGYSVPFRTCGGDEIVHE